MKDGYLEVRTRQVRLGATAMSPHLTASRTPNSHDTPENNEGFLGVLRGSMPLRAAPRKTTSRINNFFCHFQCQNNVRLSFISNLLIIYALFDIIYRINFAELYCT